MISAVFIGDEVSGAGWRLAGLDCIVAGADELAAAFAHAREEAALILIGAGIATGLDQRALAAMQRAAAPPVIIVPDAGGGEPPDMTAMVNRAFGLES